MSGHNKWTQIKRKKGVSDAEKSRVFTKYARLIALEAKKSRGNITAPSLRGTIEKARAENMPNENIERAIKRGLGRESTSLEPSLYEAYGPGGVALLIEAISDNKNKTSQEIRHALQACQATLGMPGSASWAFRKSEEGWVPQTPTEVDQETATKIASLIETLEGLDDVQKVTDNAKVPE